MKIIYIREAVEKEEIERLRNKLKGRLLKNNNLIKIYIKIKFFCQSNIVYFTEEKKEGRIYLILPFLVTKSKIKMKFFKKRIINKIKNRLEKDNIQKVVLSKKFDNIEALHNYLKKSGKLFTHSNILKCLDYKIIDKISKSKKENIELEDIYVCTNSSKYEDIKKLECWAQKVKTLNIVTMNPKIFRSFEMTMQYKNGNYITVSNNSKKALSKAKYIINWDFTNEDLNNFYINREAIFLDTTQKIKMPKSFCGSNIQDVELKGKKDDIFDKTTYEEAKLYEIYKKGYENLEISKLYGIEKRQIRL